MQPIQHDENNFLDNFVDATQNLFQGNPPRTMREGVLMGFTLGGVITTLLNVTSILPILPSD